MHFAPAEIPAEVFPSLWSQHRQATPVAAEAHKKLSEYSHPKPLEIISLRTFFLSSRLFARCPRQQLGAQYCSGAKKYPPDSLERIPEVSPEISDHNYLYFSV